MGQILSKRNNSIRPLSFPTLNFPDILVTRPFDDEKTYHIKIFNSSCDQIAIKVTPSRPWLALQQDKFFLLKQNEGRDVVLRGLRPPPEDDEVQYDDLLIEWNYTSDDAAKRVDQQLMLPDKGSLSRKYYIHYERQT